MGRIIYRSVLLTFAIDKESLIALDNRLTCLRRLKVDARKCELVIEEEVDKKESILEELIVHSEPSKH